jgi:hypothetical protein
MDYDASPDALTDDAFQFCHYVASVDLDSAETVRVREMTVEKRILIAPQDIIGLECECSHCHARCSVTLKRIDRFPFLCPNCEKRWISETQPSSGEVSQARLIQLFIQCLADIQKGTFGAAIRLEIAGDVGATLTTYGDEKTKTA